MSKCYICWILYQSVQSRPPRWPSGQGVSRVDDPGFEPRLHRAFSRVESYQWLKNCNSSGYPARRLALIGSVLGLVGPVSVYCDWVRWKVWSSTSISVWQHAKLSEQIRHWDTLACCWDGKQPTKQLFKVAVHDTHLCKNNWCCTPWQTRD